MVQVGRRALSVIPTLLIVLLMTMFLLELAPLDPAIILGGESASPEQLAAIRRQYHLDQPMILRYLNYAAGALQGDLGVAFKLGRPVSDLIAETLPVTASLALVSILLVILIGIPAGLMAGLHRDRLSDRMVSAVASIFVSVPPFVVALFLVVALAVRHAWFPATGYASFGSGLFNWLHYLILPGLALAFPSAAEVARQVRGTIIDTQDHEFIRAQYAKGLPRWWILGKHVAKNAANPIITVLGLQATRLLGSAVIIEQVFVLPGFGDLAYQAVLQRDFPLIQGIVLVSATIVMLINLAVDLSYLYFDPRTRGATHG